MKLQTSIKPRRDGTVRVAGLDGKSYVFTPDADGDMSCDVGHAATVAHLLAGQMFWPADAQDHNAALSLAMASKPAASDADGGGTGSTKTAEPPAPAPKAAAKPGPKLKDAPAKKEVAKKVESAPPVAGPTCGAEGGKDGEKA